MLADLRVHNGDFPGAYNAARKAYEEDAYLAAAPQILWQLFAGAYETADFPGANDWCREAVTRFPGIPRLSQRCQLFMLTTDYRTADAASVTEAWRIADRWKSMVSAESWKSQQLTAHGLLSVVLGRAQMSDSALRVLDRVRGSGVKDPSRSLEMFEARVRVLRGEKDRAVDLLAQYLAVNAEVRSGMARKRSWWWQELEGEPRFRELVRSGG
jgi:hypothetical protein